MAYINDYVCGYSLHELLRFTIFTSFAQASWQGLSVKILRHRDMLRRSRFFYRIKMANSSSFFLSVKKKRAHVPSSPAVPGRMEIDLAASPPS